MSEELRLNKKICKTILKIQERVALSDCEMSKIMGISTSRFNEFKRKVALVSINEIDSISMELGLGPQNIISGKIDYRALVLSRTGDFVVPSRYNNSSQHVSTLRGMKTINHFLQSFLGEKYMKMIFKRHQFDTEFFETTQDKYISSLLPFDILSSLREDGFLDQHFIMMGHSTLDINKNDLGEVLRKKKDAKELYSSVMEEVMPFYDVLCHYEVAELTGVSCKVIIRPKKEMRDIFDEQLPLSRELCLYKQGVFASLLGNIGSSITQIEEHCCSYKGGSYCSFSLYWKSEKSVSRLPSFAVH